MRRLSFLALIALAAPVAAQDMSADLAKKPEKKICRAVATTGSILGGKRECHTKAQWDAMSERASNARDSRERGMQNGAGGGSGVDGSPR
ncbi:hypothetical protein [Sphingomonas sp.]|jgi:hypothetical protein|uniref:hypothetical protein n=1 Tax=Sphingomonas sp. TaxID=28214 RepID=UPI002ED7CCF1